MVYASPTQDVQAHAKLVLAVPAAVHAAVPVSAEEALAAFTSAVAATAAEALAAAVAAIVAAHAVDTAAAVVDKS